MHFFSESLPTILKNDEWLISLSSLRLRRDNLSDGDPSPLIKMGIFHRQRDAIFGCLRRLSSGISGFFHLPQLAAVNNYLSKDQDKSQASTDSENSREEKSYPVAARHFCTQVLRACAWTLVGIVCALVGIAIFVLGLMGFIMSVIHALHVFSN